MLTDALGEVRKAAKDEIQLCSKLGGHFYRRREALARLVLAFTKDTQCDNGGPCTAYPWHRCSIHLALERCAKELAGGKTE